MCKVHPEEEIRFLSKDTYELLCRDCLLVGAHQGHSYCTIEDAAQDARRVLQTAMDQVLYKERDLTHAVKLLNKSLPSLERQQQFLLESVAKEFGKVQAAVDLRRFVVSPCMPYLSLAPSVLPFSVHLRSLIFKAY